MVPSYGTFQLAARLKTLVYRREAYDTGTNFLADHITIARFALRCFQDANGLPPPAKWGHRRSPPAATNQNERRAIKGHQERLVRVHPDSRTLPRRSCAELGSHPNYWLLANL